MDAQRLDIGLRATLLLLLLLPPLLPPPPPLACWRHSSSPGTQFALTMPAPPMEGTRNNASGRDRIHGIQGTHIG